MDALFLELGAIVFGLGVLGRLAGLIGMSPIPLYLLAGLAFGKGGILPLTTSHEFLQIGSEIGVVLLLLLIGLEYSADELLTNLRKQAPAGGVNILLNAAPGVIIALVLRWPFPAVLAMGGVTYCASSGITAKLLSDFGRIGNRETPIVLSLLVLEDLTMAFYLPILAAVVAGIGLLRGAAAEGIAIVAIAVVLVIALRYSRFVNRLVVQRGQRGAAAACVRAGAGRGRGGGFAAGVGGCGCVPDRDRPVRTGRRGREAGAGAAA